MHYIFEIPILIPILFQIPIPGNSDETFEARQKPAGEANLKFLGPPSRLDIFPNLKFLVLLDSFLREAINKKGYRCQIYDDVPLCNISHNLPRPFLLKNDDMCLILFTHYLIVPIAKFYGESISGINFGAD